jgi:cell division septation protein DedD
VAARRGKNQARRNGGSGKRSSFVPWLIAGLAIGGLAFGYLRYHDEWRKPLGSLLPTPDPDARAKPPSSDEAVADGPEKKKHDFTFFDILPEKEVVIPDAELSAKARAEQAAIEARALANEHAAAQPDAPAGDQLTLNGDGPATATPAPGAKPAVSPATNDATTAAPAVAASADGAHYVIQAGAFLGSAEAEALKAKIALTGEVARVEVAQINGNTVHRVRMGPYPNATSLAAAKSALAAHGITAQAIRVK